MLFKSKIELLLLHWYLTVYIKFVKSLSVKII